MTRTTNARIAGYAYLLYIAAGVVSMLLLNYPSNGEGAAAKLASLAEHTSEVHITVILSLLNCFTALVLAVTLYGITVDEDRELAVLILSCRIGEGVLNVVFVIAMLGLVWLGTTHAPDSPDPVAAHTLAAFLRKVQSWTMRVGATFFAVGSTIFSYLLLRGRMVPVPLAWLGIVASALLVVVLPIQLIGFDAGGMLVWLPMLVFEVAIAFWFIVKGVAKSPNETVRTAAG